MHSLILSDLIERWKTLPKFGHVDRIDNIIVGKSYYSMTGSDACFSDMNFYLVLLESGYGFSYFQDQAFIDMHNCINRNLSELLVDQLPLSLQVALADAMYSIALPTVVPTITGHLTGDIKTKGRQRAQLLCQDIPAGSKVALLGAVSEIVLEAERANLKLSIYDLEKQKINQDIFSNKVLPASDVDIGQIFSEHDYVIVTGMIFSTGSADSIMATSSKSKTKLRMFTETGSNFAPLLLSRGAEFILAEYFPFYDFYGKTSYSIFRQ